jgi:hypothetical protein
VALALGVWLSSRWLTDGGHHIAQAAAVASVTLIVAAQPVPAPAAMALAPARYAQSHAPTAGTRVTPPVPSPAQVAPVEVQPPAVQLPVGVPALPQLPVKIKIPQF